MVESGKRKSINSLLPDPVARGHYSGISLVIEEAWIRDWFVSSGFYQ